jgi:Prolipoprotein diacylglyceryl transferase
MGFTGLLCAVALVFASAAHAGLRWSATAALVPVAVLTFLGLAMATKIVTGRERLIYNHHEITVLVMTAAFLRLRGLPILPYLDLTILGIGMFLAFGRIGCLMAGCCHGRPGGWGIRYSERHTEAGFPPYYQDVRLFPVQALESLWVLFAVAVGTVQVWSGSPPGTALAWYLVAYNLGRFCFEFLRGDPARPYWLTFSEAQWTSLLLLWIVAWAELSRVLPLRSWHVGAALVLTLAMAALGPLLVRSSKHRLLRPDHVREIVRIVEAGPSPADRVRVRRTSLGVQISQGRVAANGSVLAQFTFSLKQGCMTEPVARVLAREIARLQRAAEPGELIPGGKGIFHLLIHPAGER